MAKQRLFVANPPFISESDVLSLSDGFAIEARHLVDEWLSVSHDLSRQGLQMLSYLKDPIEHATWKSFGNELAVDRQQLTQLISLLNQIGGLIIRRTLRISNFLELLRWVAVGQIFSPIGHRWKAHARAITQATILACRSLLVAWLILGVIIYGSGIVDVSSFVGYSLVAGLYIFLSTVAHELAHWITLRGHAECVVFQQGWRLGIIHQRVSYKTNVRSSLSGPAAGVVVTMLLTFATAQFILPIIALVIGGLVGLAHISSLLPSFGDGWSLYRSRIETV